MVGVPVYGYDHIPLPDQSLAPNERPRQIRRINTDEARIIVRIFEQYATGTIGITKLAKQLNAEGIAPPHADRLGWAPTCVREILRRELYRGEVIWNKTQAIVRGGKETSPEATGIGMAACRRSGTANRTGRPLATGSSPD